VVASSAVAGVADRLAGRRGVIVAGSGIVDPEAVFALADALGWPVLADPLSGCRIRRPGVVGAADAIVRGVGVVAALRPEVVVRMGAPWASRVLAAWGAGLGVDVDQVLVDPWWRWADPPRGAGEVVRGDTALWARAVCRAVAGLGGAPPWWRRAWEAADAAAWVAADTWNAAAGVTEPGVARAVARAVAPEAVLVVSSSMPVRDVEWFVEPSPSPGRTIANRGANGIDGVVSTALGAAAGGTPVIALVGDLALLHDLGALMAPVDPPGSCTVVVADNAGGGIFSFLPQAAALREAEFERLFATPQAVDVAAAVAGLGVTVDDVADMEDLRGALVDAARVGGTRVIRVRVPDRAGNVALHDELHGAMADAAAAAFLRVAPGGAP
jgi:2-succinyl-5-enolpyruvyl-6-hydroxy-3-cyclohexene-1-carboxylate synthase